MNNLDQFYFVFICNIPIHLEYHTSESLHHFPHSDAVSETLSYDWVVLGHHLVNQGAPGRDDCGQVCQGENTDLVSPDTLAPSVSVPPGKAVFGDRLKVLGDSPGAALLAQSQSVDIDPGQGGEHVLIRYFSLLGPFWRIK